MSLSERIQRAASAESRGNARLAIIGYIECTEMICMLMKESYKKTQVGMIDDSMAKLVILLNECTHRVEQLHLMHTQQSSPSAGQVALEKLSPKIDNAHPSSSQRHEKRQPTPRGSIAADSNTSDNGVKKDLMQVARDKNRILFQNYKKQAGKLGDRPEMLTNLHLSAMRKMHENIELARYNTELYARRQEERKTRDAQHIKVDQRQAEFSDEHAAIPSDFFATVLPSLIASGEQSLAYLFNYLHVDKPGKSISYDPQFIFKVYPMDRPVRHEEQFFCDRLKEPVLNNELISVMLQKFLTVSGHPLSRNIDDYIDYFNRTYGETIQLMATECGMSVPKNKISVASSHLNEPALLAKYESCLHDVHVLFLDMQYHLLNRFPHFTPVALSACWPVVEHVIYTRLYTNCLLPMFCWHERDKQHQLDTLLNTAPYTDLSLNDFHVKSHFLLLTNNDFKPQSSFMKTHRSKEDLAAFPQGNSVNDGLPMSFSHPLSKPSKITADVNSSPVSSSNVNVSRPYEEAIIEMRNFSQYKTPMGKLGCLGDLQQLICQCVVDYWRDRGMNDVVDSIDPSADDLLPLTAYVIVKAKPSFLVGDLAFIEKFMAEDAIKGEYGFVLATVQASLQALLDERF